MKINKKAIYKITNNINGKIYIGQSNNPMDRWKKHKWDALKGIDKGKSAIHDALRTNGIDNFTFEIIGWFEDYNEKEKYYIEYYHSKIPNGYNILDGGQEPPIHYGEEHHMSKYSQKLIDNIINDLLSYKYTQKQICEKYNVPQQLVTSINIGSTHRKEGINYPIIKTSLYHINSKDLDDIYYLLANSFCTCAEIGQYYGCTANAIKAINSGRNHHQENIKYPIRNFRGKANSQSVETILANRSTESIDTTLEM